MKKVIIRLYPRYLHAEVALLDDSTFVEEYMFTVYYDYQRHQLVVYERHKPYRLLYIQNLFSIGIYRQGMTTWQIYGNQLKHKYAELIKNLAANIAHDITGLSYVRNMLVHNWDI